MGNARGCVIRRAALALVMGAVVSWGVAWCLAVYRPTDGWPNVFGTTAMGWETKYRVPQYRVAYGGREVFVDWMGGRGYTVVALAPVWVRNVGAEEAWLWTTYPLSAELRPEVRRVFEAEGWNGRFEVPGWAPLPPTDSTDWHVKYSAWGWPARCLVMKHRQWDSTPTGARRTIVREDLWCVEPLRQWTSGRVRVLPTRVVWAGMALNTLVYGAVVYGAVWGVGTVRRVRRRARGLCGVCGYMRAGLAEGAACPECGERAAARSQV